MPDPYREITEEDSTQEAKPSAPAPNLVVPQAKVEKPLVPETAAFVPEKTPETPVPVPPQKVAKPVVPPPAAPTPPPLPPAAAPIQDLKNLDKDRQLKILVDLAFEQGIDKAVKAAEATENAYLIDEFHDTLVDKLREKLVERGKLKEV